MLKKISFPFLFGLLFYIPISLTALGNKSALLLLSASYYLIFLFLYLIFKKYFAIIFFIHSLICTCYLPIGIEWGNINAGMLESILRTNAQESFEFISQTPIKYFIYSILFFVFSSYLTYLCWKNKNFKLNKVNFYLALSIILIEGLGLSSVFFITYVIGDNKTVIMLKENFYAKLIYIAKANYKDKKIFQEALNFKDNYQVIEVNPKYKNYVLVIGESMRKDYSSLYGYPIDTTPFLKQIKGKVYDGFVAPSANTPTSLTRILFWNKFGGEYKTHNKQNKSMPDRGFQVFDNLVNLAKKAGYKTFWLSNHGQRGDLDIATTLIARIADEFYFSIKGDWQGIHYFNILDDNLLPILKNKLKEKKADEINLYIIHLIGSHEPFCKRIDLKNEKLLYKTPDERLSCYLHSITKTDEFLKNLNDFLKEEFNTDYSVLYFSDHGLAHLNKDYLLRHHYGFKQNYESPLVIFNGDDTKQERIKVKKSGYNFIFAFAEWLGIREKNLEAENYTFFNNEDDKNIKVYNWDKDVDFDSLPRDIRFVEGVEKLNP